MSLRELVGRFVQVSVVVSGILAMSSLMSRSGERERERCSTTDCHDCGIRDFG